MEAYELPLKIYVIWNKLCALYARENCIGFMIILGKDERLKDLRVERSLTLGRLAEQTGLSKSALGSYETEDFKDISHDILIKLANNKSDLLG